ncbi:MAG: 30S ribosomal protein S4 [Bacteroidota bacterium]|nr:30S ribosomal protein S4 [Bacteroidota bacterium]MDP4231088.1 30S ribosomal protein S4 [Bacteroidota bacterium]MDP4236724.1 30S ribosomal protein S4 [Bacteroidota bacterium]
MARYTDPSCKLCRREKQKLFLKGSKCFSEKCPVEKRNFPPGQHGMGRRSKISEYGIQLREKQKVRRTYGMLETQFRNTFEKASQMRGVTGDNLVKLLERRFDNVVYRLNIAPSRKAARQLILHGHVQVNGKSVNIPSYLLNPGDVIQLKDASRKLEVVHESLKRTRGDSGVPSWLSLNKADLSGTFLAVPERADIPLNANEQLIVELYSK